MHLSCGQCRKIQPFSGDPPCCEICGWMVGRPIVESSPAPYFKPKEKPIKKWLDDVQTFVEKLVKIVMLGGLSIVGLLIVIEWLRPEKDKLAEKYNISPDKVIVEPKPHGCDFDDAPLGSKHCHYEEEITPIRECDTCRVTSVYVSWRKVSE